MRVKSFKQDDISMEEVEISFGSKCVSADANRTKVHIQKVLLV